AVPAIDAEDEAEPIFAMLAEAGPANGAAQGELVAFEAGLLANLAAHAGDDVLVRVQLAAEAVVLAEVRIVGASVAVDEQHASTVRREDVTERCQGRSKRHDRSCMFRARRISCNGVNR